MKKLLTLDWLFVKPFLLFHILLRSVRVQITAADSTTPLYPQKLAFTSPANGCRSVTIVRSRTRAKELIKVCSENLNERGNSNDLGLDGGTILKLIFDEHNGDGKLGLLPSQLASVTSFVNTAMNSTFI
jgi:hypothetical protein